MLDHVGIQVDDITAAKRFYDTVLEPLGYRAMADFEVAVGYGAGAHAEFWIGSATDEIANRPGHIAFTAPSREAVDEFHRLATGLGLESLHAPRVWPEYHDGYYGAFVRDPDGNNVEAVHHTRPGSS